MNVGKRYTDIVNPPPLPSLTDELLPDPEVPRPSPDAPALERLRYFLFHVPREPRTNREIVRWWERRRFAYNVIVGVCGLPSWILVEMNAPRTGYFGFYVLAVVAIGIVANILYCLGWVGEIVLQRFFVRRYRHRTGKWLMTIALVISLSVVLAPAILLSILIIIGII